MEFWPQFYKDWNNNLILPNIRILALFLYTLEFWPNIEFWRCFYKHLGILILSFYCDHWNCGPHPSTQSNSGLIFTHSGIPILSFQTLECWLYFYTLILSFKTLGFWPYFYKHCKYDPMLANIGFLALFLYTLEFYLILPKISISAYFYKNWNSDLFLANIGILILLFQTMEFWPYFIHTFDFWPHPSKQWNSGLILINTCLLSCPSTAITGILVLFSQTLIWVLPLFLCTLEFWRHPSKHCNSGPICIHIEFLILSFQTLELGPYFYAHLHIDILTSSLKTLQFWPYLVTHWNLDLILSNIGDF